MLVDFLLGSLSLLSSLGLHLVSHFFVQHSPSHAFSLISPISPVSFAFRLFFFLSMLLPRPR